MRDSAYNPSKSDAYQVALETGGDVNATYDFNTFLTEAECDRLARHVDENEGKSYRGNENDKLIMFRNKEPLEDIIGLKRAGEIYKYYKEKADDAPVTQVWLRRMGGVDTTWGL